MNFGAKSRSLLPFLNNLVQLQCKWISSNELEFPHNTIYIERQCEVCIQWYLADLPVFKATTALQFNC